MRETILCVFILFSFPCNGQQTESNPEINVIYGDQHIFTIETPKGWVNDKKYASTIGLVSFFYAIRDKDKKDKSYIYAMGYDKESIDEKLSTFVKADLNTFRKKYPEFSYEKIDVGSSGGILNSEMYSFDKLGDRYKEEVVYMETEYSILVFSFAAFSQEDYQIYQPIFDRFIASFNYKGDNPKPYIEWLNGKF